MSVNSKILDREQKLAIFVSFSRLTSSLTGSNWNIFTFVSVTRNRLQRTYSNCRLSLFSGENFNNLCTCIVQFTSELLIYPYNFEIEFEQPKSLKNAVTSTTILLDNIINTVIIFFTSYALELGILSCNCMLGSVVYFSVRGFVVVSTKCMSRSMQSKFMLALLETRFQGCFSGLEVNHIL